MIALILIGLAIGLVLVAVLGFVAFIGGMIAIDDIDDETDPDP